MVWVNLLFLFFLLFVFLHQPVYTSVVWLLCASLLLLLLRFFLFNVFSNWIKMADIDLSSDFYFVFLFFKEKLDSWLRCLPSGPFFFSLCMDFNKWRVIVSEQKIHVLAAILILFDSPVYYTRRIHANNPRCSRVDVISTVISIPWISAAG
mgnify:CR=1 FL=1